MSNEVEYHDRVMNLLTTSGGRVTLHDIRKSRLVPSVHVLPVMRELCASRKVILEGDSTYVLPPKQPQGSLPLRVNVGAIVKHGTEWSRDDDEAEAETRKCCRCYEPKSLADFDRPGLQRVARKCNACHAADESRKSAGDDDFQDSQDPNAPPVDNTSEIISVTAIDDPLPGEGLSNDLHIPINSHTREYLQRLVRTGLFGESIEEAAERLIWSGLEQRLPMLAKVIA